MNPRILATKASGYTAKTKTLNDREFLVVPVVALVEGVVWASNSTVPELVTLNSFKDAPIAFNGKPLFLGHPLRNGVPVVGSHPEVIESSIGLVFNTQVKNNKLMCEAWIDVAKAQAAGPDGEDLLARARAGQDIEISVGVAADETGGPGEFNGKAYEDVWGPIAPDHLALLPTGHKGACSLEMGCGVRAAAARDLIGNGNNQYTGPGGAASVTKTTNGEHRVVHTDTHGANHTTVHATASEAIMHANRMVRAAEAKGAEDVKNMYIEWLEAGPETDQLLKALRNIPQEERDKLPEEDFAGPNRSFPIAIPEDVSAAASSLGRAKGNRNAIKRRIISIAYRKGDTFVAQLPEDWKKKADQTKMASLFSRFMKAVGLRDAQAASDMTENDLRMKLSQALSDKEGAYFYCVETYFPVTDPAHVVYTVQIPTGNLYPWGEPMYDLVCYERAFTLSDSGVITLNDARIEVEQVVTYEPVEGASPITAATKNADAAASCSCKNKAAATMPAEPASGEQTMKFESVNKALEASNATPEQAAAVVAFVNGGFKAAEVTVEKVVEKEVVKEVPAAEMTREQAIEKFGLGDAVKAAEDNKAATMKAIKANKANTFTDEQLNAKSQAELNAILALAGSTVRAAIDHAGRGGAKDETEDPNAPVAAAPSLDEKIKANRAASAKR
jgi:hypothetical protein